MNVKIAKKIDELETQLANRQNEISELEEKEQKAITAGKYDDAEKTRAEISVKCAILGRIEKEIERNLEAARLAEYMDTVDKLEEKRAEVEAVLSKRAARVKDLVMKIVDLRNELLTDPLDTMPHAVPVDSVDLISGRAALMAIKPHFSDALYTFAGVAAELDQSFEIAVHKLNSFYNDRKREVSK